MYIFSYFVTLFINIESALFVGYMNVFFSEQTQQYMQLFI